MNVILYCNQEQQSLLPLTFLKPAGELRMGIFTFKERWQHLIQEADISYFTDYCLQELFPLDEAADNLFIHSSYFPTLELRDQILSLEFGEALEYQDNIIAYRGEIDGFDFNHVQRKPFTSELLYIERPYHLFLYNDHALRFDFDIITKDRKSQPISSTNGIIAPENIFLEEGAKVEYAILNATDGPIYIGNDAEICEGSMVRGGLALCEHAKLNMGAKIYGATTIGPWCKVGGEVNNSILTAYSNKGHDGFLGNSVIGEWCNLGADTNNSNLKNNYGEVKLWDYSTKHFEETGLQFCGLMMGDHSKAAINTQFNTGTVTGIFANIFKSGFPPNQIESFTWGGNHDSPKFNLESAYEVAKRMMSRRGVELTPALKNLITYWYDKLN
ncbi:MAG: GlmU family protein [Weeksellaceae bacterium]